MRTTTNHPYPEKEWEHIASGVHHPSDTRRSALEAGTLVRNRRTGLYAFVGFGGSFRSVPQRWARELDTTKE